MPDITSKDMSLIDAAIKGTHKDIYIAVDYS